MKINVIVLGELGNCLVLMKFNDLKMVFVLWFCKNEYVGVRFCYCFIICEYGLMLVYWREYDF